VLIYEYIPIHTKPHLTHLDPHTIDGAWDHRRYCLELIILQPSFVSNTPNTTITIATTMLHDELQLCETFLKADERNFHCWSYRRYIVNCLLRLSTNTNTTSTTSAQPNINNIIDIYECEMKFSLIKIQENFSNYSAYHHRSVYIKHIDEYNNSNGVNTNTNNTTNGTNGTTPNAQLNLRSRIDFELKIIENAMFTEPDDQSIWWYYQYILRWIVDSVDSVDIGGGVNTTNNTTNTINNTNNNNNTNATSSTTTNITGSYTTIELISLLLKQVTILGHLLELEPDCKWCKVGMIAVINTLLPLLLLDCKDNDNNSNNTINSRYSQYHALKCMLLDDLCVTDNMHIQHYISQK